MRKPPPAALAGAVALLVGLTVPTGAVADEHDHAPHDQPGNPITELVASNAELVNSDPFTGGHVMREGDRAYVGAYGVGFRIFDISDPDDPVQIGGYLPGERADAVPDAAVYGGRHLAVLNGTRRVSSGPPEVRTDKSEFLDVTDPANPVLLHVFVGQQDGEAHNGDIADARRWWLPSGGTGVNGLRIYDLSPTIETSASQCRPNDAANLCAPVNIFRANPVDLWMASPHYRPPADGRPEPAFTHTHDITVYLDYPVLQANGMYAPRDIILLAEGGNYTQESTSYGQSGGNTGSAFVIDVTNPRAPVVLLRWFHPRGLDHHPIRYHHEAQFLDNDERVMLVTDEDLHHPCGDGNGGPVDTAGGGSVAVRLSEDLTQATELSEWFIPAGTPAPVCSVHVFDSQGPLVAFGSYNAGLQAVDYSDPADPVQVGYGIAPGTTAWGALWNGEYVYVGDMSRGLDTYRWTGPVGTLTDLTVSSGDISFSKQKVVGGDRVTITAQIRNAGEAPANGVLVRFEDNGALIGYDTIESIPAGGTGEASLVWDTKHLKGEHTITVTADPHDTIDESDEGNNSASRTVTVRGNKVRNGSFEQSSNGSAPDDWSSSGQTSYTESGSDGSRSVTAGLTGSWTSEAIAVEAGRTYGVSVDVAGAGGTLVVEQLSATGELLGTLTTVLGSVDLGFATVTDTVTVTEGVAQVRIRLTGGLTGTTFDDVRMWEG